MDLEIEGKVALVLGGGGGLGSAAAARLAAEGARVVIADIHTEALDRTAASIAAAGGRCSRLEWDLTDLASVEGHAREIESTAGAVDILVNITGGPPPSEVTGVQGAIWRSSFDHLVLSVITITDCFLPGMRERGWGRVITSTSSGVVEPIRSLGLSNTLRSSLVGWSKTLAREVGTDGVTANVVVPGRIATGRIDFLDHAKAEREGVSVAEVSRASTQSIAAGRYGTPAEYADLIAFLASARASYITGSMVRIDGGMLASV
ncbi:SDR family oxidoreductase [Actinomadura madurae]|uniref:SDR family oxidoreductase n=1 Tax=Actinomadura madurae TaxID=1993 RepID=UPI00399A9E70